jgi:GH15 family glucan-1,4-alpha-glucosidase
LNEIYYPRVDCACTRDLGLIVADGRSLFSEEKRDTRSASRTFRANIAIQLRVAPAVSATGQAAFEALLATER